ncbi:MAG: metallophosphoesterase family protein [Deltaproteobacteria bacterium]
MKTLILSDIHSNWHALEAVLSAETYDSIIFLGDAVDFGPNPRECLKFLIKSSKASFWGVRGDHDHAMAYGMNCRSSQRLAALSTATRDWGEACLRSEEIGFLRRLPLDRRFTVNGLSFHMIHGFDNHALPQAEDPNPQGEFEGIDFMLSGHSHKPFIKQLGNTTILNPGSVGQPRDNNPRASYAIIEDGVASIKRIKYDIERTVKDLQKTTLPKYVIQELVSILVSGGVPDDGDSVLLN